MKDMPANCFRIAAVGQELRVEFLSCQQVNQADVVAGLEQPAHEQVETTDPIDDHRGLPVIKQLKSYRARDGNARMSKLNDLGRPSDAAFDIGQSAVPEVLIDLLQLGGIEARHQEAHVGPLRMDA